MGPGVGLVWGPSVLLLTQDQELQEELEDLRAAGGKLLAWEGLR